MTDKTTTKTRVDPQHAGLSMVTWYSADVSPPRSRAPFQAYLVWLRSPSGTAGGGIARVVQFSRENQRWNPGQVGGLIVTHWAECPRPAEAGPEYPWKEE